LFGALLDSAFEYSRIHKEYESQAVSIDAVAKQAAKTLSGPVVVFPEGTCTNGELILKSAPVCQPGKPSSNVNLIGLRYDGERFSATFPVGNFFVHLFRICSQMYNKLDVKTATVTPSSNTFTDNPDRLWTDVVLDTVALKLIYKKRSSLGLAEKKEFLDYWFNYKQLYKGK